MFATQRVRRSEIAATKRRAIAAASSNFRSSDPINSCSEVDVETFRDYCLAKAAVTEGTPFGPDVLVFKVGGKIFALLALDDVPATANLKCDLDRALELRDQYEQVRPGYHMNKKHWNTVEIESGIADFELRNMIDHSYGLVVRSLPIKERLKLEGRAPSPP
jgi:predicted DNA-binding protein (MmcQ/YjbR family)